jgi:uncharacterized protein (TIGR03067 family)
MTRICSILFVAACWLLGAEATAEDAVQKEKEKLVDTWAVTAVEVNGQKAPPEATKSVQFVITAAKVTRKRDGQVESETGYRLDLTKTPKWIDFTDLSGVEKDKTFAAVYALEGNTLKLCYRLDVKQTNKRAVNLDGGAGSGQVLLFLRLEKP